MRCPWQADTNFAAGPAKPKSKKGCGSKVVDNLPLAFPNGCIADGHSGVRFSKKDAASVSGVVG